MNTPSTHTQNRIIAPICIGISLLLGVGFLKPAYTSSIEKKALVSSLETEQRQVTSEYDDLVAIRDNISTLVSGERRARIQKLAKKYNTSDIMSLVMLNDFTKDRADETAAITISSISVGKGNKLPSGLSLGSVALSFQGKTIADIISFITFLTKESSYVFTLDSISLPLDTEDTSNNSFTLGINLGFYYYE